MFSLPGRFLIGDKFINPKRIVWEEFAETTTCHGVREILRSKKTFWKIFWTISVLFHVCFLVIGCTKVVVDYYNAPTVTKVSLIHAYSLKLPRLAFCLPNGLDKTRMRKYLVPSQIIREATNTKGIHHLQFNENFHHYLTNANLTMKDFITFYSYTCKDLLLQGGFGDNINYNFCNESKTTHHKNFGLCHIISGGDQVLPGVQGGYKLKFRLPISFGSEPYSNPEYQDDFWSFTSGGVAIELEQYYEHLNLNPLLISRNHIAAVSLRLESHLRVKEDGKCIQPELSNFTSGNTCFFWCRSKVLNDMCQCGLYGVSDIFDANLRLCTPQDITCITAANLNMSNEILTCQKSCKPLCEEWEFKPTVTYINMANHRRHYRHESFVHVVLGYSAMEYKQVQEVRAFTIFMAVSNLGGQAGLWMGCSILTLIHAITYCFWALTSGCTTRMKYVEEKQMLKRKFSESRV